MYTPPLFKVNDDDELRRFIHQYNFGILVSHVEGKLWATHLPFIIDQNRLTGHISRGNKQWRGFTAAEEVMVIFIGPNTYISSSWYDHENVPTWNYQAVHVYGRLRIIEGPELLDSLRKLTDKHEQHSAEPVSVDRMDPKFVQREMQMITGIEITIDRFEASYKLSQNRDQKNHENIISELKKKGDENSTAIAQEMTKRGPNSP